MIFFSIVSFSPTIRVCKNRGFLNSFFSALISLPIIECINPLDQFVERTFQMNSSISEVHLIAILLPGNEGRQKMIWKGMEVRNEGNDGRQKFRTLLKDLYPSDYPSVAHSDNILSRHPPPC